MIHIGRLWLNRLLKLDKSILVGFFPYPFLSGIPPAGVGCRDFATAPLTGKMRHFISISYSQEGDLCR
jgi:hypothetical protein